MDSVMKMGTCLRPSWTAMVCPTISGKTVEARDQVLSILFCPEAFISRTHAMRRSSTNGPFFVDRLTQAPSCLSPSLAALAPANDVLVRRLVLLPRAVAQGRHTPGRHRVPPRGGLALAAAVRVVDRVHRRAAHGRPPSPPPR